MKRKDNELHDLIYNNELDMAQRKIIDINKIMSDDFIEFGTSGKIYSKQDELSAF